MLGEEFGDGGIVAEGGHQLDLGVFQLDEDDGDAVVGEIAGVMHVGAEQVAVFCGGGGKVWDDDGDVVEAADHGRSPLTATRPASFPRRRESSIRWAGRAISEGAAASSMLDS